MLQDINCPKDELSADEWQLLDYAMMKGGHAIEKIRLLDGLGPETIHGKIGQLNRLNKHRLPALKCLEFAPDFELSLAEFKNGEHFFDRIHYLTIYLKNLDYYEQTTRTVRTAAIALRKIPSLKMFIVIYQEWPWVANNIEVSIGKFEVYMNAQLGRIKWIIDKDECTIDEQSVCTMVMRRLDNSSFFLAKKKPKWKSS